MKVARRSLILLNVVCLQALLIPDKFQHILRVLNTNIDGRQKIMFGLTAIKVGEQGGSQCVAMSLYSSLL